MRIDDSSELISNKRFAGRVDLIQQGKKVLSDNLWDRFGHGFADEIAIANELHKVWICKLEDMLLATQDADQSRRLHKQVMKPLTSFLCLGLCRLFTQQKLFSLFFYLLLRRDLFADRPRADDPILQANRVIAD